MQTISGCFAGATRRAQLIANHVPEPVVFETAARLHQLLHHQSASQHPRFRGRQTEAKTARYLRVGQSFVVGQVDCVAISFRQRLQVTADVTGHHRGDVVRLAWLRRFRKPCFRQRLAPIVVHHRAMRNLVEPRLQPRLIPKCRTSAKRLEQDFLREVFGRSRIINPPAAISLQPRPHLNHCAFETSVCRSQDVQVTGRLSTIRASVKSSAAQPASAIDRQLFACHPCYELGLTRSARLRRPPNSRTRRSPPAAFQLLLQR